jgi:hypothetical protein
VDATLSQPCSRSLATHSRENNISQSVQSSGPGNIRANKSIRWGVAVGLVIANLGLSASAQSSIGWYKISGIVTTTPTAG